MTTKETADGGDGPGGKQRKARPQSEDRKAEIARIAYRLIAQNGLEGLRTRQVAAEAGIDQGTLHYHFGSKEALIQAVVDCMLTDFQKSRSATSGGAATALAELRGEFQDLVLRVRQTPRQFQVWMEFKARGARDPIIGAMLSSVDRSFHQHLAGLITRGIEQRLFREGIDVPLAASIVATELVGLASAPGPARENLEAVAEAICGQLEGWLMKKPLDG